MRFACGAGGSFVGAPVGAAAAATTVDANGGSAAVTKGFRGLRARALHGREPARARAATIGDASCPGSQACVGRTGRAEEVRGDTELETPATLLVLIGAAAKLTGVAVCSTPTVVRRCDLGGDGFQVGGDWERRSPLTCAALAPALARRDELVPTPAPARGGLPCDLSSALTSSSFSEAGSSNRIGEAVLLEGGEVHVVGQRNVLEGRPRGDALGERVFKGGGERLQLPCGDPRACARWASPPCQLSTASGT